MSESVAVVHVPKPSLKIGDVNEWGRRWDGDFWVREGEANDQIPDAYEGNPIPPNDYCRAWNAKESRLKYCRNSAGTRTDHPGEGRCRWHGGVMESRAKGVSRRRYKSRSLTVGKIIEDLEQDQNPLDILQEIQIARALLQQHLEENDEPNPVIVLQYTSEITRMVERVFSMRSKMTITYAQLARFLFVARQKIDGRVRAAVRDPNKADELIEKIYDDLRGIRP